MESVMNTATIGNIIRSAREEKKMTTIELADAVDMTDGYISVVENDIKIPSNTALKKFASVLNLDYSFLIKVAQKARRKKDKKKVEEFKDKYGEIDNTPVDFRQDIVMIPVLTEISAGDPKEVIPKARSEAEEFVPVSVDQVPISHVDQLYSLRVKGDSMIDANINDGSIVIVDPQANIKNGDIVAIAINSEAAVKRFYKSQDHITLQSANPKYPPLIITSSTGDYIRIIGKVVATFNWLP